MNPPTLLGILSAITSALVWGAGDFSGGLASRRSTQYQVVTLSALSGIVVLVICALLRGESIPSAESILWAVLGGAVGAMGMAALYQALSLGHIASVAPTSAVVAAALPVLFSLITLGAPSVQRLLGFALAFIGIYLVSMPARHAGSGSRHAFILALLAGAGFGGFFILIGQIEPGPVFTPLIAARAVTFLIGLALVMLTRQPLPSFKSNPIALLAGVLDSGGNIFYMVATQMVRLDVAAVLSAMYPASTVVLAAIILKEKISPWQLVGVFTCLAAIALITL